MSRRILIAVGTIVLALGGAAYAVGQSLRPLDPTAPPRVVIIPKGASSAEIGLLLQRSGLIRSARDFALAARLSGRARALQDGEYRLSAAMGLLEILERLARGDVVLHTVTIPEGFTAAQVVDTLAARGLADRDGLRAVVRSGARTLPHPFLRDVPVASLEGYLFPDTYRLPRHRSAQEVIAQMVDRFAEVVLPLWQAHGGGRPLHEVVTVASLVEREARVGSERALIAGVLYNRLARGWRLEVDATVLYALGRHKPTVTYRDLEVNSPYNTYRHPGLPPGPIANPGLAAIEAALRPAATDYLYYVARPDGSHAFSRTLAEHLAAVRRYRHTR